MYITYGQWLFVPKLHFVALEMTKICFHFSYEITVRLAVIFNTLDRLQNNVNNPIHKSCNMRDIPSQVWAKILTYIKNFMYNCTVFIFRQVVKCFYDIINSLICIFISTGLKKSVIM